MTDDELWYCFQTLPMGEVAARAWLARQSLTAWYPELTRYRDTIAKGRKARVAFQIPAVRGYLFGAFTEAPDWPALRYGKHRLRAISHGEHAIAIPVAAIARMAQIPERLAFLARQQIEHNTIRPGDKAHVTVAGCDWLVDVSGINRGLASFILPLLGGHEVEMPVERMRKAGR